MKNQTVKRGRRRLQVWRHFRDPDFCVFFASLVLTPVLLFPVL